MLKLADFIPHAAKLGFESVMIAGKRPHLSPLDAAEQIEPLKAALHAANIRCDVIGAYTNLAQPVGVGCEVPQICGLVAIRVMASSSPASSTCILRAFSSA